MQNVTGREKVVTCGWTKPEVVSIYSSVLKLPVLSVLWLVVIKLPCGVQCSYCPYPKSPNHTSC